MFTSDNIDEREGEENQPHVLKISTNLKNSRGGKIQFSNSLDEMSKARLDALVKISEIWVHFFWVIFGHFCSIFGDSESLLSGLICPRL